MRKIVYQIAVNGNIPSRPMVGTYEQLEDTLIQFGLPAADAPGDALAISLIMLGQDHYVHQARNLTIIVRNPKP